jgi:hypothetical protein
MITLKQVLGVASVGLILFTMYEQNKTITKQKGEINALKNTIQKQDSINANQYDDVFNAQSENGRYELTLEYLKEVNPKAAKQFKDYMAHETE